MWCLRFAVFEDSAEKAERVGLSRSVAVSHQQTQTEPQQQQTEPEPQQQQTQAEPEPQQERTQAEPEPQQPEQQSSDVDRLVSDMCTGEYRTSEDCSVSPGVLAGGSDTVTILWLSVQIQPVCNLTNDHVCVGNPRPVVRRVLNGFPP